MVETEQIKNRVIEINSRNYNLLKLAEECTELSDVLIKMVTKETNSDQRMPDLIDELGDVLLRSDILIRYFAIDKEVTRRIDNKAFKMKINMDKKLYENY